MDPGGPQLAHAVSVYRFENSLNLAGKVLFLYDFLLMSSQEISFIHQSKWTVLKFTYIASRYLPFADIIVLLHLQFTSNLTEAQCVVMYKINAWLYNIGMSLTEVVLTYRLWVIWDKSRWLKYALLVYSCAVWTSGIFPLLLYSTSHTFFALPQLPGCIHFSGSRIVWVNWILLLLYNTTTLVLLVIRATSSYWSGTNSRLLKRWYRDAIWCYLSLFLVSMINVVVTLLLPLEYADILLSLLRSLHSNLSARAVLGFRTEVDKLADWSEDSIENII